MAREKPKIDPRKFSDLLALLKQRLPHYTPEWPGADDQDSGVALLKLFSHLTESVIKRLNQTPHQNLVAFLSMLGIKLLPAEPSRVPVRFKLVAGTSNEVLVPQRTQTTSAATDTRPELPFETEEDLLATPSPLASVFSIDPEKDAIYQPPQGFLEREMPDTSAVAYALISFSRAGSNTLQLDHTDNLGKGDLLKLVSTTAMSSAAAETWVCPALSEESETTATAVAEYVPIAEIKGTIVVLSTKLMRDYAPDTPVEKITKFHVFESRNLQEHTLYLGHKDLFNVKSPVLFTLNIALMAGTEQGLEPLQVAWEYWGEIKGQEGTDWQPFAVQLDGSDGLSQNGEIELLKTTEGEIKELEVNGIKNRWIRAKLQEPLPANATRRLPVLDNIAFRVESAGDALPPDQAFHNDTPLDVNLPFYPLGLEPRLFDKFQLASKEVFSKKGAEVEIDIRADSLAILAAPAAVLAGDTRRIFARGTGGRLLEFRIQGDQRTATLHDHGVPPDTVVALPERTIGTEAAPSIVTVGNDVFVFLKAENGALIERLIQTSQERWIDLQIPSEDVRIKFDPAAIQTADQIISVFAVADDGNLYELRRNIANLSIDPAPAWVNRGKPPIGQVIANSSPCAVTCHLAGRAVLVKVFVAGSDGQLHEWNGSSWQSHAVLPAQRKIASRPFALLHCPQEAKDSLETLGKVWVRDDAGNLQELDIRSAMWQDLGKPSAGIRVDSIPHGLALNLGEANEEKQIFVRGSDNRLWKIGNAGNWTLDPYPGEAQLRHSPFVLNIDTPKYVAVYSSTNKNAIIERRYSPQKALSGTAQVGTDRSITLADSAPTDFDLQGGFQRDKDYIKLETGELAGTQRKLLDFNRELLLVHIDADWDEATTNPADKRLPDSNTEYAIGRAGEPAVAQDGSLPSLRLATEASKRADAYNDLEVTVYTASEQPLLRNRIVSYQGDELKTAKVEKAWRNAAGENVRDQISRYKIELEHSGTPGELTQASIKLGEQASANPHAYDDMKIVVKHDGSDLPPVGNKVLEYFGGEEKRAWVSKSWDPESLPRAGDQYEIKSEEANVEKATFANIALVDGSSVEGAYDGLDITVTSPGGDAYARTIDSYDGRTAILENEAWQEGLLPDSTFTYQFKGIEHSSKPDQNGERNLIYLDFDHDQLATHDGAYDGFQIIVTAPAPETAARARRAARTAERQQTRQIEAYYYDAVQRVAWAVVSESWEPGKIPTPDYEYELVAVPRSVADAAMSTITLNQDAGHAQNPLQGMSITVKRLADNEELPTNQIIAYDPATRMAILKWPWSPGEVPDDNYNYVLHASGTVPNVERPAKLASITLDPAKAKENPGAYDDVPITLRIGDPPARNGNSAQINHIVSYEGGAERRAFVRDSWHPDLLPLTSEHLYKLEAEVQSVRGVAYATIKLSDTATGEDDAYVGYGIVVRLGSETDWSQRANIIDYEGASRLASVDIAWKKEAVPKPPVPGPQFFYALINYKNPIHRGIAQVGTRNTITLDRDAASALYDFVGRNLRITAGPGQPRTHVIGSYLGSDRVAILRDDWTERPTTNSSYEIEPIDAWQIHEDANALPITPQLSWEYWNSRGWVAFLEDLHQFQDGTKNLLIDGKVIFLLPQDLDLTEVSGQESYWIRARIIGGDYGRETYVFEERVKGANSEPQDIIKETKLLPVKSTIRPPQIFGLTISYKLEEIRFPDRCLTYNNLDYVDQTDACITTDKRFPPFVPLEGQTAEEDECGTVLKTAAGARAQVIPPTQLGKAIYLGFMNPLRSGPLKIFFAAKELPYSDASKPKMEWSYRAENEWQRLSFGDASEGLIKQEILQFIAPRDFTAATRFGAFRYWLRGMLLQGEYAETPVLGGIYPNTTWAFQAETRRDEILGSSNGEAGQTFRFFRFPVRAGQIVRVREVLTEEEKEELIKLFGEQALHEVKDELGKVLETWVLWTEVDNFFDSKGTDRRYTLDRATGELRFGDGRNGQIPPAGLNNLRVFSYQAGGGAVGNVEAGAIQSLTTAIANVEAVINPVQAGGGSDTASLDDMLVIGPAMINHRQRAVAPQDFEWLAKQASRQVAKARCVRNLDSQSRRATGWVTLYLVPHSRDSEPQPSLEMRRMVQRYVAEHCANTVAAPQHIFVAGPVYAEIDVLADLVVNTIDAAARVEQEARAKLADFLHPLTGGPTVAGWEFGQGLSASDVYVLLEQIEGLDHVQNLSFSRAGVAYTDLVEIGANELVAGGTLRINVTAKTGA
ncbi:putative baseplate assembly protein [candidate division KSB1 bacterium]|nr:MAG: putative baseplate assembly protein [candidate division KSB1 bacterium]MCE7941587.1 putative baseplate assembly protein [Chlorobi bacterium CHB1]